MATVKLRKNNGKLKLINTLYIISLEEAGQQEQNTKISIVQGDEETYQNLKLTDIVTAISYSTDLDPIDLTTFQPDP